MSVTISSQEARERPILFSGPMVRAILDGTKTQTRRVIDPRVYIQETASDAPDSIAINHISQSNPEFGQKAMEYMRCPYGAPGDRLWVRETWASSGGSVIYKADEFLAAGAYESVRWRPSIHMPRWASRLTLQVTDVRVERLQDISEADAIAEGVRRLTGEFEGCYMAGEAMSGTTAVECYARLWDSINAKRAPWESNPWVWVVSFEKVA